MYKFLFLNGERAYPYVGGLFSLIVNIFYSNSLIYYAQKLDIDLSLFFNAIFNIALVLTAFLFSFFGIAIAPGNGFIEKIIKTKTFKIFTNYIIEALIFGSLLSLLSITLMISKVKENYLFNFQFFMILIWSFVSVTTLLLFYRVAHVFIIFMRTPGNNYRLDKQRTM